jgi:hypothetical protein
MTASPFAFYEVVVVQSSRPELREIAGERGVIMGMAEEAGQWSYSVSIESSGISRSVGASDIKSTGEVRRREEFYDGSSIRVSKDGKLLG